jgi:hypothetical protein
MENKKTYVGSGKQTNEYFTNISVCLSDLPKESIFEYNGKKYVKLTVGKKKEADDYGKTHYVAINDYQPEEKKETKQEVNDDLPF